jgi:diacylglycerol O-acyltransferase / wax synthase
MSPSVGRPMEPFDTLMYRSEQDPRGRSTLMGLFLLDSAPEWEHIVQAYERVTRVIVALRERVVEPLIPVLAPTWIVDPDFDLGYHLRRVSLPAPGTRQQLLEFLEPIAMTPLDRARPLWELILIEGLADGTAAWVIKMNHAVADGVGGQALAATAFDFERNPPVQEMPLCPVPGELTPGDVTRQGLTRAPISAISTTARGARTTSSAARALVRQPRRSVVGAGSYLMSLRRVLAGPDAEPSPLMRGRSLRRRLLILEVPKAELRAASRAAGGSLNDGFLAAVTGALRLYHERLGVPVVSVPVAIPISLRTADDPDAGNRWVGARLSAPVAETDPAQRIESFHAQVRQAREEPALDAMSMMAPVAAMVPMSVLSAAFGGAGGIDLQLSNVPGSPVPMYLAGAKIVKMIPFGPVPGPAAMITVHTYLETCFIGVNLDPAAIVEPELFEECLNEGFAEVLALNQPVSEDA